MRFSEMNSERAADVLCECAVYVEPIVTDAEFIAFVKDKIVISPNATKAELLGIGLGKLVKLIPLLLKTHKEEAFGIVAAVNDRTIEEIKGQNIMVTINQIREILNDKELILFFKSCAVQDAKK